MTWREGIAREPIRFEPLYLGVHKQAVASHKSASQRKPSEVFLESPKNFGIHFFTSWMKGEILGIGKNVVALQRKTIHLEEKK